MSTTDPPCHQAHHRGQRDSRGRQISERHAITTRKKVNTISHGSLEQTGRLRSVLRVLAKKKGERPTHPLPCLLLRRIWTDRDGSSCARSRSRARRACDDQKLGASHSNFSVFKPRVVRRAARSRGWRVVRPWRWCC